MAGDGIAPGDEVAVVSGRHILAPGVTGSTGDRGPFAGPNGLPVRGDRARIFASGSSKILNSVPPNGWQVVEQSISFVSADEVHGSDLTMPLLASIVQKACGTTTVVHYATDGNRMGEPNLPPRAGAKSFVTNDSKLSRTDGTVLCAYGEQPERNTPDHFRDALQRGLPIIAFRRSLQTFGFPVIHPYAERFNDFGPKVLGAEFKSDAGASTHTRIMPPDAEAAKHPILSGVEIPVGGLLVPGSLFVVAPLAADCRVLLWGETVADDPLDSSDAKLVTPVRQPVLWIREPSRDYMTRPNFPSETNKPTLVKIPPQRIAVMTLGEPSDFAVPEFRVIAAQMVAWAIDSSPAIDAAQRSEIRANSFVVPSGK